MLSDHEKKVNRKEIITLEQLKKSNIPDDSEDERFMKKALEQAKYAMRCGEVPIGCVIVRGGEIIGRGYNRRNTDRTALAHAEITAIRRANRSIRDWRLDDCTLYVTLEPCQMCAGAIIQARIPRVVIGADSDKAGSGGSIINILQNPDFMHQAEVKRGVLEDACRALLKRFFKELRTRSKEERTGEEGAECTSFPLS